MQKTARFTDPPMPSTGPFAVGCCKEMSICIDPNILQLCCVHENGLLLIVLSSSIREKHYLLEFFLHFLPQFTYYSVIEYCSSIFAMNQIVRHHTKGVCILSRTCNTYVDGDLLVVPMSSLNFILRNY